MPVRLVFLPFLLQSRRTTHDAGQHTLSNCMAKNVNIFIIQFTFSLSRELYCTMLGPGGYDFAVEVCI